MDGVDLRHGRSAGVPKSGGGTQHVGVGVGRAVSGRLELRAGRHEVGHDLGTGVRRPGGGERVEVVDLREGRGGGQARVLGVRRAEPGGGDGRLDETFEALCIEPGGGGLRDPTVVHDDAQTDVVVIGRHVLVDSAVGEAGEGVGALRTGDEGVGPVPHQPEHAIAGSEAMLGDRVGARFPRHQRTPTRTSVNRAGTDGCPVWPTWIGWPLPQLAVPQNTHSSGPPTMSIDAQNRGPMPV